MIKKIKLDVQINYDASLIGYAILALPRSVLLLKVGIIVAGLYQIFYKFL